MEMPKVPNRLRDPKRNITITFWAHRTMTEREVVKHALVLSKTKKLKRNSNYDVITTID